MNFVNLTPHAIVLNDGTSFPPSGTVARVGEDYVPAEAAGTVPCWTAVPTAVQNLPAPQPETIYIVSGMVLSAVRPSGRTDVVAPATGHPAVCRNEKGHIVAVSGFVR